MTLRLNLNCDTTLGGGVRGDNLANETYIRYVNNNGGRDNPGAPRSARLTSAVSF